MSDVIIKYTEIFDKVNRRVVSLRFLSFPNSLTTLLSQIIPFGLRLEFIKENNKVRKLEKNTLSTKKTIEIKIFFFSW